jgi:hypothetical protein
MKRNLPVLGLIIGLILPVIGFFIASLIFSHGNVGQFLHVLKGSHNIAAKVCTLGLLINIAPFIFYTNKRLDQTAKGIFIATVIYAVLIFLLKFVW